jgi:hypothetical protein
MSIQIARALQERKRTFLEQPEWKTIPWAADPLGRSHANYLLDMLADVPGLLEDETHLDPLKDPVGTDILRHLVLEHLYSLYEWRWAFESRSPGAIIEVDESPRDNEISGSANKFHRTRLQYTGFVPVNELSLYNAIQLFLLRILLDLVDGSSYPEVENFFAEANARRRAHTLSSPLLLPGEANSLLQVAVEICRLFECQQQTFCEENRDSVLAWLMPMGLAYQVLFGNGGENTPVEGGNATWAADMLRTMPYSFQHACFYIAGNINLYRLRFCSRALAPGQVFSLEHWSDQ